MTRVSNPFPVAASVVEAATDAVRAYCGWHVAPTITETVRVAGTRDGVLQLPSLAVVDVGVVTIDGAVVSDFVVRGGYLLRRGGWGGEWVTVEVSLTHGLEDTYLGRLVEDVAARAAASPAGHVSVTVGGVSTTNAQTAPGVAGGVVLMDHERRALDVYRLPGF